MGQGFDLYSEDENIDNNFENSTLKNKNNNNNNRNKNRERKIRKNNFSNFGLNNIQNQGGNFRKSPGTGTGPAVGTGMGSGSKINENMKIISLIIHLPNDHFRKVRKP